MELERKKFLENLSKLENLKNEKKKISLVNQNAVVVLIILGISLFVFFVQKGFLELIENVFNNSEGVDTLFVSSSINEKYNTLKNIDLSGMLNYLNIETLYLFLLNILLGFNLFLLSFIEYKKILIENYKEFFTNVYVLFFKLMKLILFIALPTYLYVSYTGINLNEITTINLFMINIQLSAILMVSSFLLSIYSLLKISKKKNKLYFIKKEINKLEKEMKEINLKIKND